MPQPTESRDVVAASEGVAETNAGDKLQVTISIERPFTEATDAFPSFCAVQVRLSTDLIEHQVVSGTDSLEALTNAIVVAAATVRELRRHYNVTFHGHPSFAAESFLNFAHGDDVSA